MKTKLKNFFKNMKNIVTLVAVLTLIVGGITVGEIVTSNPSAKTTKVETEKKANNKVEKKDAAKEEKKETAEGKKTEAASSSTKSSGSSSSSSKKSGGSSKSSGSSGGGWTSYDGKTPYTPAPQPTQHVHNWVYKSVQTTYNSYPVHICKGCGTHWNNSEEGCPNCGSCSFSSGMDSYYRTLNYRECPDCGACEDLGYTYD